MQLDGQGLPCACFNAQGSSERRGPWPGSVALGPLHGPWPDAWPLARSVALGPLYGPRPEAWPLARTRLNDRGLPCVRRGLAQKNAAPYTGSLLRASGLSCNPRRTQVWDWSGLRRPGVECGKTGSRGEHGGRATTPPRRVLPRAYAGVHCGHRLLSRQLG